MVSQRLFVTIWSAAKNPGSFVHGTSLSAGVGCPISLFPRIFPTRIQTRVSHITGRFFVSLSLGKPYGESSREVERGTQFQDTE